MSRFPTVLLALCVLPAQAREIPSNSPSGAEVSNASEASFTISTGDSLVYALVRKAGAASAIAHDHVIKASIITGSLVRTGTSGCSINVTIPISGLLPDPDALRKAAGLPDVLSDSQRTEIRSHMRADDQLSANRFPQISFRSTRCSEAGKTMQINGELTIRGKSRAVSTKLKTTPSGSGLRVNGSFEIMQSWFGYAPYSALAGLLKVSDDVEIVLDIALEPTPVIPVVDEPKPSAK